MSASTIPITVTDEGKEFIAQLGMQREFQQMLEHALQTVPNLLEIEVVLDPDPSQTIGPGIVIWCHRPDHGNAEDRTDRIWGGWKVDTFSPQVCFNFVMISCFEPVEHER